MHGVHKVNAWDGQGIFLANDGDGAYSIASMTDNTAALEKIVRSRNGRLVRMLRAHLTAQPDAAFTTDELCARCRVERKHRVAVRRTLEQMIDGPSPPPHGYVMRHYDQGGMLVWFNPLSATSIAEALRLQRGDRGESITDRFAEAERMAARYRSEMHGTLKTPERWLPPRPPAETGKMLPEPPQGDEATTTTTVALPAEPEMLPEHRLNGQATTCVLAEHEARRDQIAPPA
jgi:hypothetical protein